MENPRRGRPQRHQILLDIQERLMNARAAGMTRDIELNTACGMLEGLMTHLKQTTSMNEVA